MAKVIIEYEAQAASLKQVTDTIINANKQIGDSAEKASKEGAEAYKQMGKSMASAFSSQEVSKALNSNIANINKNRDALTKLTGESIKFSKEALRLGKVVKESAVETLKAKESLARYQKTLQDTGNGTDATEKKTQSLKSRLRELKEELSALETAGQDGTEAFQKLAIEAGKLQDQIGDTQERVKVLSSDTFKFDAAVGAVQGLAGAFAVAQGAATLFGSESEDLNKTIAKTQGAIALLTGLQEVANLVTGQAPAKLALLSALQSINAASVRQSAVSYNILGASVQFSARSLNILKGALAATGVGLLVIGIGILIEQMQKQKDRTNAVTQATKDSIVANLKAKETLSALAQENEDINNRLLVQSGEISQEEADRRKVRSDAAADLKSKNADETKRLAGLLVQEKNLTEALKEKNKEVTFGQNQAEVKQVEIKQLQEQITEVKRLKDESIKTINDVRAASEKKTGGLIKLIDENEAKRIADEAKAQSDRAKEIRDKAIQDRITAELNGLKLIEIVNGESLNNKIAILNKEAELEKASATASITNSKLRASTLLLIDAKLAKDTEQLKLDEQNKLINNEVKLIEAKKILNTATLDDEIKQAELSFNAEKSSLEAKIKLNQASASDLEVLTANSTKKIQDIRNRGIQEDYNLRVQSFELQKMLGATSIEEEVSLIRARGEAELKANEQSNSSLAVKEANRKSIIAKTDADITQAKVIEANKRIDIENTEAQASLILGTSTYDQRVKLIEDEGKKAINSLDKKLMSEQEYNSAVVKINADTTAKLNAEQQARIDKAFEYLDAVANVFGEINALSQQLTENRIQQITESSEAELEAINNSNALETEKARNRQALEKRTARIIAEEKRKQAVADKALAVFEIGLSTARGIMAALAGPPPNPPLAAFIGIAGAIQLAAALAKPIPKFEKGGEVGGQRHSQGGTMVEAEQGEYIVNRKQTSAHRRELNALNQSSDAFKKLINDRYVRPAIMNYMLGSKSKEMGVNVNATLNSKTMEAELKGLRKDLRNSNQSIIINQNDSRYLWHKN